jgi:propanol-preferring alcohol dehydrogenase
MKAMILKQIHDLNKNYTPLEMKELPDPQPGEKEILVKVAACGVCHTELDEIEGRTPPVKFPMVLGHQVVGSVQGAGSGVKIFSSGDRVGIAWIFSACGTCRFCLDGNENLCTQFLATGRDANGGYAQLMVVPADFAYQIPAVFSDVEAAPLLCAGAIGYRSLALSGLRNERNMGLVGFGASAHIVLQLVKHQYPKANVMVIARNEGERTFARQLGAAWTGDIGEEPPEEMDCIIDTTPAWKPVVEAMKNLAPGGRLVINAIRKENVDKEYLLRLDYPGHLWMEKEIKSVANVTRNDVREFLRLAADIPIRPEVEEFSLQDANRALIELKQGKIRGAKVLKVE